MAAMSNMMAGLVGLVVIVILLATVAAMLLFWLGLITFGIGHGLAVLSTLFS